MSLCGKDRITFSGMIMLFLILGSSWTANAAVWRHHERQAPDMTIGNLFALPDGKLAAGTDANLHFFDRTRWTKKNYGTTDLPTHIPLYADSSGKLYFNSDHRLAILDGGAITISDSVPIYEPVSFTESNGLIYIGSYNSNTYGGLYTFDGQRETKIYNARVYSLAIDKNGTIWITGIPSGGSSTRLLARENGGWVDYTDKVSTFLPSSGESDFRVSIGPDGSVWAVYNGSYAKLSNGSWTTHKWSGSSFGPSALRFDPSGRTWGFAASVNTLYLLNSSGDWVISKQYADGPYGMSGFLAVASDSTVFTCDGDSLFQYAGSAWKGVANPHDLGSDQVTSVAYLKGKLLCGHGVQGQPYQTEECRGLSIYDGSSWTNLRNSGNSRFDNVYLVKASPADSAFIYSDGGCYFYDGETFSALTDSISWPVPTDVVWYSPESEVLISTKEGIIKYFAPMFESWKVPAYPYGMSNFDVDGKSLVYMQARNWNGDPGGQILIFDPEANTLSDTIPRESDVTDIAVTLDGTVWAAKLSALGWWKFFPGEWEEVTSFTDTCRIVQRDPEGRMWASSYGKTGYYADGVFTTIPELSGIASNAMAFSSDGAVFMNAFDRERTIYSGLYEYVPVNAVDDEPDRPGAFLIGESYPNPFNPTVTIRFTLPKAQITRIQIYNVTGQRVRTLANREFPAGVNRVVWDSTNDVGARVSSGVYFYRLEAGKRTYSGKMTLLR